MTLDLKRYSLTLLAMILLVTAVSYALPFIGIDVPAGMSLWLPPMIAALDLGQRHGRSTGQPLAKGAVWRKALPLTAVALALQALVAGLTFVALAAQTDLSAFREIGTEWLLLTLAFAVIVTYLTNVIFLSLGVKHGAKIREREGA